MGAATPNHSRRFWKLVEEIAEAAVVPARDEKGQIAGAAPADAMPRGFGGTFIAIAALG